MVGIVVYAGVFAAPGEVDRIRGDWFGALGYVANWRFVFSGQSYFDQFTQPSPLRHMWSLAIEEQFYLVWPLIVCFLLWWRRVAEVLLVRLLAMIAASAMLMAALYVPGRDPSRVYYGTDTRAQSLLIGAVVGILVFRHGPIRSLLARRRCGSPPRSARATRSGCSGGCRNAPTRSTRAGSCSRRWRCRR